MRIVLQPEHFTRHVTMSPHGLQATFDINGSDRETAAFFSREGNYRKNEAKWDRFLKSLNDRESTHVVLNPADLPPEKLLEVMKEYQRQAYGMADDERPRGSPGEREYISLARPFSSGEVGAPWTAKEEFDAGIQIGFKQGQQFTLVGFHREAPVGFVVASLCLYQHEEGGPQEVPEVFFTVNVDLVYVAPPYRHLGFSLDLSLAMSFIVESFFLDLWNACPNGTVIKPSVDGELASPGGEAFMRQVFGTLEAARDIAFESGEFSPEVGCEEVVAEFCW